MVLVDTSVWLDFLTGRNSPHRTELRRLIELGIETALMGIILQEILQGIRSDVDARKTERHLAAFRYLPLEEPATFREAASIYRECRKRGRTIRKPVDALIAAQALRGGAELFHNDRDFNAIAAVVPLKIYKIPS